MSAVTRRQAAMAELLRTTVLANPYVPHAPTAKQARFLLRFELEAFYGGAAGGGKSDALLMAALQYVSVPGYAALLLRKSYADLVMPGALMDRAHEWLDGTDAHWHEPTKTWTFPSGATLTFGYLQTEKDKYRYRSAEFQFVGWDELTDFTESQYTYLLSRLRRLKGMAVPVRCRAASNPDGPGSEWVRHRFVMDEAEQPVSHPRRVFVPATLDDNPHLDAEAYELSLAELDVVTRAQLRSGDWTVRHVGGMFDRGMVRMATEAEVPAELRRARYWDLAGTKPTAKNPDPDWTRGMLAGYDDRSSSLWLLDLASLRDEPGRVEGLVRTTAAMDGYDVRQGMEQEPGQSGKAQVQHYARTVLPGHALEGIPSTGDKVTRARRWMAAASNGLVVVVAAPWNRALFAEAEAFPQQGVHDDTVDAVSGVFDMLAGKRTPRMSRL